MMMDLAKFTSRITEILYSTVHRALVAVGIDVRESVADILVISESVSLASLFSELKQMFYRLHNKACRMALCTFFGNEVTTKIWISVKLIPICVLSDGKDVSPYPDNVN